MRDCERTFPGITFLLPYYDASGVFGWDATENLVQTPKRNYTVLDYKQLFQDSNWTYGYQMRQDGEHVIPGMFAPNVEVMCIHGSGKSTKMVLVYQNQSDFPNGNPATIRVNGDGEITMNSLSACLRFSDMQIQKFTYKVFANMGHVDILNTPEFILYLEDYLKSL